METRMNVESMKENKDVKGLTSSLRDGDWFEYQQAVIA